MGVNSLLSLLESLCCNSPWNYAVFWKLKCQHEMILDWEDGFCDIMNTRDPLGNSIEDFYLESSNKMLSSTVHSSLFHGTPGEYPIGLAVAEMSSASHVVGKGVVGEAALTGNPRWIYSDNMATEMFGSVLAAEYPDEWLLQFIAGIKTIMILPVLPHGVLQLGSIEMVGEDATLVDYAKQKFEAHNRLDAYDMGPTFPQFSLMSTFTDSFDEPNDDQKATHYVATKDHNLFAANQNMPLFQDFYNTTNHHENVIEYETSQQELDLLRPIEPQFSHPSWEDSKSEITENNVLESSFLDEKVPYFDNFDQRTYDEYLNELMDFHSEPTSSSHLSFPMECELHKALVSGEVGPTNHIYTSSILDHDLDFSTINVKDLSGVESAGSPLKEDDIEHLLETVLAYARNDTDDSSKNQSEIVSSVNIPNQSKRRAPLEEDKASWSFLNSRGMNLDSNFSPSKSSIDYQRKESRLSSTKKRRVSGPNNQKPRPRDRQLIQDRIKELRGLVPNTDKCSIDGLLDKTIKHMLFLRSVTDQADKLRPQVLKEESDENSISKSSELNRGPQCGTSWAVEIGSEHQQCPIVVKDLDQPGQMLIEMLCSDHGRFLEIADVIHRSQLTILKAVMGKCSENSWARFIVEASGSFQRLDIFWPLMQLLQQKRPPVGRKTLLPNIS